MSAKDSQILLVEDNKSDAMLTIRALKKHNLANNLIHRTGLGVVGGFEKRPSRTAADDEDKNKCSPMFVQPEQKMPCC